MLLYSADVIVTLLKRLFRRARIKRVSNVLQNNFSKLRRIVVTVAKQHQKIM